MARVGIGLIGVWSLVAAVQWFMSVVFLPGVASPALAAIPAVILLGLSYLLVFHNAQIAAAIAPDAGAATETTLDSPEFTRVMIAIVGVYFLAWAIPGAVNSALGLMLVIRAADGTPASQPLRSLIGYAVQVAFALYLIRRPERLLGYIRRPLIDETA